MDRDTIYSGEEYCIQCLREQYSHASAFNGGGVFLSGNGAIWLRLAADDVAGQSDELTTFVEPPSFINR